MHFWSFRQMAMGALQSIGNPPVLYWAVGTALFSILLTASVAPLLARAETRQSRPSWALRILLDRRFYGLMVVLAVVSLRWPLLTLDLLNSDESHSIACAMKLGVDPIFWRGIDGTTGGPLLYYPLLLPRLVGLPFEYASARAVGLAALIGSILLLYGIVRRLFDEGIARVAVLPLVTSWALATAKPFTHYSSEQIPVFLVTLGLYFLVRWWQDPPDSIWTMVLCGLVLGALPFAKLQAVPMGLLIAVGGALIILRRYRHSARELAKRMMIFIASGLGVSVFFLLMVVSGGVWRDFWQSYIMNNLGYGNRYLLSDAFGMPLAQRVWAVGDRSFWTYDLAELTGATLVVGVLVLPGALILARRSLIEHGGALLLAIGLVLVSAVAVAYPGTMFAHYFLFLAVPLTLLMAVWLGIAVEIVRERSNARWRQVATVILVAAFIALTVGRPLDRRLRKDHPVFSRMATIPEVITSPVAEVALGFARPGEAMAVWGWEPWRFVESGLYPATRDTQTQWQILDTPQRPYYLERYRGDLLSSLPPVFVDAVGYVEDLQSPGRPLFWDRETQAHDVFPEIAEVVDQHYQMVGEVETARVYVSRDRLAELERLTGLVLTDLESADLVAVAPRLSRIELGISSAQSLPEPRLD